MRVQFFKNTSSKRIKYAHINGVRMVWVGPLFMLVTKA